jgi:hypothetical protein
VHEKQSIAGYCISAIALIVKKNNDTCTKSFASIAACPHLKKKKGSTLKGANNKLNSCNSA